MHAASDDFLSPHSRFPLDLAFLLDTSLQTIQPVLAHRGEDWAYLLQLADALKKHIGRLPSQALNMGACHGDAQGGNANLTGEKLTFFDFDVCGHGWRVYDLAVFYWGAALGKSRLGWNDQQVEQVWAAYLEGYQEQRPLSDLDLQAIPLFVAVRHFWFLGVHTANWDYWGWGEVNDRFFDGELTFLREWVAQHIERA
jgi:Ser/Thr protein kinase RdoA (MazF antagonist)